MTRTFLSNRDRNCASDKRYTFVLFANGISITVEKKLAVNVYRILRNDRVAGSIGRTFRRPCVTLLHIHTTPPKVSSSCGTTAVYFSALSKRSLGRSMTREDADSIRKRSGTRTDNLPFEEADED